MSAADAAPQLAQIEAVMASIERDTRAAAVKSDERSRQRAVEARAGRMGSEWQEVQRRIDAGETSVEDVFTGRDQTPAARRLVDLSQRNLTELGRLVRKDEAVRDELAEVDRELAQWDVTGAAPDAAEVRSATDPTTGAAPTDDRPVLADRSGSPGSPAGSSSPEPERDPVADRVDATDPAPDLGTDPEGH